jgi:3-oxoacyl-[acyl-carrier protein] reductase
VETGLAGRTALVTGGTRGIGFAIAQGLIAEGARVAILARTEDALTAAVTTLGGEQVAQGFVTDLSDPASVDDGVGRAASWGGGLHVVVNCAGPPMQSGTVAELGDDPWVNTFTTKAAGAVRVSRAAIDHLAEDGSGRIINISGVTAASMIPNAGVTAMTNSAVQTFTKYLAAELAPRGVLVNAVCPGMTLTEGWLERAEGAATAQGITRDEFFANMTEKLGLLVGRWAQPSEIANVVTFLASDLASFVTGQTFIVDGGQAAKAI